MSALAPLAVALPLGAAAGIAAFGRVLPRRVADVVGIAAAATTAVLCVLLLVHVRGMTQVYWFGGWKPTHGVAIGIAFTVDPAGAAFATLAAVLATLSLVFSWGYFEDVGSLYHTLMLVFLAGMVGFCLTGDLFNLFVFFELMGVAAFALTAYRVDEVGPIQGSLNFAVTNSIGAFLVLTGIALVYGRTGALNLAQIGRALPAHHPDGLVVVAFTLLVCGFLVKAAVVPFHFWLADAYAVAPSPVCALLAGVMGELGIYAVARIYWTAFDGALGAHLPDLRVVLVVAGLATALVGGTMALLQRHLKRLLAYSTLTYLGMLLAGVGLASTHALAGAGLLTLAHGLTKASLFLAAGIVVRRIGSSDELRLRGRGRALVPTAIVFFAGAVALAGLPPFGTFRAKELLDAAAADEGLPWVPPLLLVASIMASAAILRAAARVFLGWGPSEDSLLTPEPEEDTEPQTPTEPAPTILLAPTLALAAAGLVLGLVPGIGGKAVSAADRFSNRPAYAATVLESERPAPSHARNPRTTASGLLYGFGAVVGAAALAALALFYRRLGEVPRALASPLNGLRALHSGHVGDYTAWITLGTAALGGIFALVLR